MKKYIKCNADANFKNYQNGLKAIIDMCDYLLEKYDVSAFEYLDEVQASEVIDSNINDIIETLDGIDIIVSGN